MKTHITKSLLTIILTLTVGAISLTAQPAERNRSNTAPANPEIAELRMLARLAQMDDAQLTRLENAIAEIRALSPEEREQLAAEAREQIRSANAERGAQVPRARLQNMTDEERAALRQQIRSRSPEERRALREEMRDLTPEERAARMREIAQERRSARAAE